MAHDKRRQLGILAGLLAVLLVVLVYNRDGDPVSATTGTPARSTGAIRASQAVDVDIVRLDALTHVRPEPQAGSRNPFRFQLVAPPPPPSVAGRPGASGIAYGVRRTFVPSGDQTGAAVNASERKSRGNWCSCVGYDGEAP